MTTTPAQGKPQSGGSISVSFPDDVGTWDTTQSFQSRSAVTLQPLVTEGLARPGESFKVAVPALASRIEHNASFTRWTVTLRPGAKFSDGRPVTVQDVVFTFDRVNRQPAWSYLYGSLQRIRALGGGRVEFDLAHPDAEFDRLGLATAQSGIIPKDFDGLGERAFWRRPIGAGPFAVQSWTPGQQIVLARNRYYWDPQRPRLDRVTINVEPDDNSRLLALESGQIAAADHLAPGSEQRATSSVTVRAVKPSANTDLLFLSTIGITRDVNVRRAIWYAIDRAQIAKGIYRGAAQPAVSLIPPGTFGQTPGSNPPSYDLARARAYMAKSAYPHGGTLEIVTIAGNQARDTTAQALIQSLGAIGIKVRLRTIRLIEFQTLIADPHSKIQAVVFGYEAVVIPASDILGYFAATAGFHGGYPTGPTAQTFAKLQTLRDEASYSKVIAGWEDYVAANAFDVPLVQPYWLLGQTSGVQGLAVLPTGGWRLDEAWKAR